MGANSIFNQTTIPDPRVVREDVVTPLSEISVSKKRKVEEEVLLNAHRLLAEVRDTTLVTQKTVVSLRTLAVKAGKARTFKNDAERVELSHLTYQVRHLLEDHEAEMVESGPFAQAMKDANKKEEHRPNAKRYTAHTGDDQGATDVVDRLVEQRRAASLDGEFNDPHHVMGNKPNATMDDPIDVRGVVQEKKKEAKSNK